MSTILTIKHLTGSLAGRSQRIVLQEGQRLRLGRSPDTDIKFSDTLDDAVSGTHAEISLRQGRLYVEDKRSSNGTFVNGAPCPPFQQIAVPDGSRLRLAKEGPEMQVLLQTAPTVAAAGAKPATATTAPATAAEGAPPTTAGASSPTAVSGISQVPAKEFVGRATLLREIDRAREEERDVVTNQLASTQRSTGRWIALGLIVALLLAALGISGAVWWNRRQLAAEHQQLKKEVVKVTEAFSKATENVWADVEKRVSPAIVLIRCAYRIRVPVPISRDGRVTSDLLVSTDRVQASGVLIRPGLVLTARHVAEPWKATFHNWNDLASKYNLRPDYELLEVQFPGNQQPLKASFVASSEEEESDLALLQFQPTSAPNVPIVGSNNDVKVTDVISVISYPAMLGQKQVDVKNGANWTTVSEMTPTFVNGVVTQPLNGANGKDVLTFDAAVTHGCSGGAVLNEKGQLIGIVSAQFETTQYSVSMRGDKIATSAPVPSGKFAVGPDAIHRFLRTHGIPD